MLTSNMIGQLPMYTKLFNKFRSLRINETDFIVTKNSNLFIGGVTGRSGTTWLTRLLANLLNGRYCMIGEHGAFVLAQLRNAGYEVYQVTPGNAENRKQYLKYFYDFVTTKAYDRTQIYGKGQLSGFGKIVPKKAIDITFKVLESELEKAQTLHECNKCFGNFYSRLLNYHSLRKMSTLKWISKEPPYGRHIKDLYSMIPDCRVVITVRDGRDTALSMAKKGWGNGEIMRCTNRWKDFTQMTLDALADVPNENYLLVKYEDLISRFQESVQNILDFYNVDLASEIIEIINGDDYRYAPQKNNFNKWKREFSKAEAVYFEKTCSGLMEQLGYEA